MGLWRGLSCSLSPKGASFLHRSAGLAGPAAWQPSSCRDSLDACSTIPGPHSDRLPSEPAPLGQTFNNSRQGLGSARPRSAWAFLALLQRMVSGTPLPDQDRLARAQPPPAGPSSPPHHVTQGEDAARPAAGGGCPVGGQGMGSSKCPGFEPWSRAPWT